MNEKQIKEWCQKNNWTELAYREEEKKYYAFPPGAVMPVPVPNQENFEMLLGNLWQYKGFIIYGFVNHWISFSSLNFLSSTFLKLMVTTISLTVFGFVFWLEKRKSISQEFPQAQLGGYSLGSLVAFVLQIILVRVFT
jgi:hypothetical protein